MPPRILRFRLRLAKFNYSICHVPLYTADALSRAPTGKIEENSLQEEAKALVESVVESLPTSPQRLDVYKTAQEKDFVCHYLKHYCRSGWPAKPSLTPKLLPYVTGYGKTDHFAHNFKIELLVFKGSVDLKQYNMRYIFCQGSNALRSFNR